MTILTARDLNQDLARAKRAALDGPVVITDRGRPAHVLMTWTDYQRLIGARPSLAQALAMPGLAEIDLQPPRLDLTVRPTDLS